jgi:hypothetical protein
MSNLRRMVIELEVLYDASIGDLAAWDDLPGIYEETISGHASGSWEIKVNEGVSAERMRELLEAQGSDPDFLGGDDDGESAGFSPDGDDVA